MEKKNSSVIAVDEAARRVGSARYGKEWIGDLTEREKWLIARYVDGSWQRASKSIMATEIGYFVGGRSWAEYPSDKSLLAEVERARDRSDYCKTQWEQAFDWLEQQGLDVDADCLDGGDLNRRIAARFGVGGPAQARKRGAAPRKREFVIQAMKADLTNGYNLEGATEEEMASKYGASRDTCRRTRNEVAAGNVDD